MARWVILKTQNGSEYLNLDMASRIIHRTHEDERQNEYIVEFFQNRIAVKNDVNPATYAHIAAHLGDIDLG